MRCLFLVFHRKLRCISYEIKPYEGCAINHTNERNPNMGRTELREHIFKMLFCREFNASKEMPEQLLLYFEQLEQKLQYRVWFCGHYHINLELDEKHVILYKDIVCLDDFR